jgi:hypothetical protein
VADDSRPREARLTLGPSVSTSGASAAISTGVTIGATPAVATAGAATPLIHLGSASVYPGVGASQVIVSQRPDAVIPEVQARVTRDAWDMGALGVGLAVGDTVLDHLPLGHIPGVVIGAAAGFAAGRVRWWWVHRKVP